MPEWYEFFAGGGLVRLGLKDDWRCTWANDNDPSKVDVYRCNFGSREIIEGDIENVKAGDLPGVAAMAWASFPCQDLSLAGWRRGLSAERSGTYWTFWRLMRDLHDEGRRPPLIVLENVLGLLGADFSGLCESLVALEMQYGALVVDARHFVPQSRPRVFVVAADARLNLDTLCMRGPSIRDWFPEQLLKARRTLNGVAGSLWRWWKLPHPECPPDPAESILEDSTDVKWHASERTAEFVSKMSPVHRDKLNHLSMSDRTAGFAYQRTREGELRAEIRVDGLAGCLRTATGGSSRQVVVEAEEGRVRTRLLTANEAARLMGVSESYELPESYTNAYHVMGDGVVVPVVSWLSEHLLLPVVREWEAQREALGHFVVPDPAPAEVPLFLL